MQFCKIFHFADDINLLHVGKNTRKLQKEINSDLKTLYQWMLANMISLNKDKTEMIIFHSIGTPRPYLKIKLNGKVIYPSKYVKYVGVFIDETLTFDYHCKFLWTKLNRALGMLYKCRHYLDPAQLKTLYFAIFNCHLTYGCQVWGQKRDGYTEKIFTIQNKAMRALTFSEPRTSQLPLYKKIKDS